MAKIPKNLRRNPESLHVKVYAQYRVKREKPKAVLFSTRGESLTSRKHRALTEHYKEKSRGDLQEKQKQLGVRSAILLDLIPRAKTEEEKRKALLALEKLQLLTGAAVAGHGEQFPIIKEIILDFRRTRGLKVFGFGVGYGQLLFFLKNFMGAKVKGVDLGNFSRDLTKEKKLGVEHGKSVSDPALMQKGKFDVTYSINVFEDDIIDRKTALGMLDNLAAMTRKNGKSYHIMLKTGEVPVTREEVVARGFRIDKWKSLPGRIVMIKLTKITD